MRFTVICLASFLLFAGIVFSIFPGISLVSPVREIVQVSPIATPASSPIVVQEKPTTLLIPTLNISAEVEYVGLDNERRMDIPKAWENVAWYERGPVPGETGSAVIAGHLDSPTGPAVFYSLAKLKPGDSIIVQTKQGKELEFVVELVEQYKDAQFPISEVFSSSDGEKRLNLITCAGTFSQLSRRYSDRLVVFTVLKEIAEG